MNNGPNGSCLMRGWSPLCALCCAWNVMPCCVNWLHNMPTGCVTWLFLFFIAPSHMVCQGLRWMSLFGFFKYHLRGLKSWYHRNSATKPNWPSGQSGREFPHISRFTSLHLRPSGAYANNQHQLKNEINANPRKTSFYRAMKLCMGVLLVLDQEATPFTRSLGSFGKRGVMAWWRDVTSECPRTPRCQH